MEHSHIEENNLIDRYVRGTLPVEARDAFEEHFVDCHECLTQLEVARSLREAIRIAAVDFAAAAETRSAQTSSSAPRGSWAWRWWSVAATACLGIALLASALLYEKLQHTTQDLAQNQIMAARDLQNARQAFETAQQTSPLVYVLNQSRGGAEPARNISIPKSPRWILFSTELDTSQFRGYQAVLRDQGNQPVWRNDQITAASSDALAVAIPSTVLKTGPYHLQILGLDARGSYVEVASFTLRAAPQK